MQSHGEVARDGCVNGLVQRQGALIQLSPAPIGSRLSVEGDLARQLCQVSQFLEILCVSQGALF